MKEGHLQEIYSKIYSKYESNEMLKVKLITLQSFQK